MIDRETYRRIYGTGYQNGRRDGAEEARKQAEAIMEAFAHRMKQTGAAEMRERAAQAAVSGEHYGFIEQDIADAIRALPITPEEPG